MPASSDQIVLDEISNFGGSRIKENYNVLKCCWMRGGGGMIMKVMICRRTELMMEHRSQKT